MNTLKILYQVAFACLYIYPTLCCTDDLQATSSSWCPWIQSMETSENWSESIYFILLAPSLAWVEPFNKRCHTLWIFCNSFLSTRNYSLKWFHEAAGKKCFQIHFYKASLILISKLIKRQQKRKLQGNILDWHICYRIQ